MIGRAGKVLRLIRVMRILRVFKVKQTNIYSTVFFTSKQFVMYSYILSTIPVLVDSLEIEADLYKSG